VTSLMKTFVACAAIVLVTGGLRARQEKPVVTTEGIVDSVMPPPTLREAAQQAAAIVIGTVTQERTHHLLGDASSTRAVYSVKVSQVLRSNPLLTQPVFDVYRYGGDVDKGDHIIRRVQRGFPRFVPSHRYLMFLSWNEALQGFQPQYGPNSVFELSPDGRVDTPGKASYARSQTVKSSATLIADIRQALGQ
jgi:hypothetical protein